MNVDHRLGGMFQRVEGWGEGVGRYVGGGDYS